MSCRFCFSIKPSPILHRVCRRHGSRGARLLTGHGPAFSPTATIARRAALLGKRRVGFPASRGAVRIRTGIFAGRTAAWPGLLCAIPSGMRLCCASRGVPRENVHAVSLLSVTTPPVRAATRCAVWPVTYPATVSVAAHSASLQRSPSRPLLHLHLHRAALPPPRSGPGRHRGRWSPPPPSKILRRFPILLHPWLRAALARLLPGLRRTPSSSP